MLIYFFRKENHVTAAIDKGAPPAMSGGNTTPPATSLYLTCSFAIACSLLNGRSMRPRLDLWYSWPVPALVRTSRALPAHLLRECRCLSSLSFLRPTFHVSILTIPRTSTENSFDQMRSEQCYEILTAGVKDLLEPNQNILLDWVRT